MNQITTRIRTHWPWLVVAALVASILLGSLLTSFAPTNRYGVDKVLHFSGYGGLMFLCLLVFESRKWRRQCLVALCVFGLGLAVEAAQHFLPYRKAALDDVAFNALGVAAGWLAARFWFYVQKRRLK